MEWINEYGVALSVDASGHEHRGKGEGGGQFVKNSENNPLQDVIDGKRKPTSSEYGELLDQGYEWNGSSFEKPEEIKKPIASEEISDDVHKKAKSQLSAEAQMLINMSHNWEESKPWNVSSNSIMPSGFALTKKEHGEVAHFHAGKIQLSSKFFQPPYSNHEDVRRHIIYHELGHQLADTFVNDGTSFQLRDAGVIPSEHDMGSGTGGGHGDEEALADAYALLHTDPKWLQERYPKLAKVVYDRAVALGMPVPKTSNNEQAAMSINPALWANEIQRQCLVEAGDDIAAGLAAAGRILANYTPETLPIALSTATEKIFRDAKGRFAKGEDGHLAIQRIVRAHRSMDDPITRKHATKALRATKKANRSDNPSDHLEAAKAHHEAIEHSKHAYRIGYDAAHHLSAMRGHEAARDEHYKAAGVKHNHERLIDMGFSVDAYFAHDIHNPAGQAILNRSLKAIKGMSAAARKDLQSALKKTGNESGSAILAFVNKYRLQLANLLTTTQLASLLEGAREVAEKVPPLGTTPVEGLSVVEQEAILKADVPIKTPDFSPPKPTSAEAPDAIHYPIIEEAVKNLTGRNIMDRQGYDALEAAARAKAFTVANVAAEETLTKIRDSLANNVKEGIDYATWSDKVLDEVGKGTFLSDAHQETVFRTNIQTALSDGQMSVLSHPLVRSGFPYSTYDAIHDDRARHNHLALEELGIAGTNVYRNDDPVFQTFRPPWDFNDRCGWTPITVRQAAERGVPEAVEWLKTGVEPTVKAHVPMPDFRPPEGFHRALSSAPLSIQLSLQSIATFSTDATGHQHKGKGEGGGQFTSEGGNNSPQKTFITDIETETETLMQKMPPPAVWLNSLKRLWRKLPLKHRPTQAATEEEARKQTAEDYVIKERLAGLCSTASSLLRKKLAKVGVSTRVVGGGCHGADHAWLETSDGTIIDGTASQFDESVSPGQIVIYKRGSKGANCYKENKNGGFITAWGAKKEKRTTYSKINNSMLSVDSSGHQHKGKGEGGGQFTSTGVSSPDGVKPTTNQKKGELTEDQIKTLLKHDHGLKEYTDTINALAERGRIVKEKGHQFVELFHVTDADNVASIKKNGLVPGTSGPSGQEFKATHSKYATYFHQDPEIAKRDVDQSGGGLVVLRVLVPIRRGEMGRFIPDEDSSLNPLEGPKTLREGGPIAVIGKIPKANIKVVDHAALSIIDKIELAIAENTAEKKREEKTRLISEILVVMFGEDATEVAEHMVAEAGDEGIQLAVIGATRGGKKPGKHWQQYIGPNGGTRWRYMGPSWTGGSATPPTPAPAPTPVSSPAPAASTPAPTTPTPAPVATGPSLIVSATTPTAAFHAAMQALTGGKLLTQADKMALVAHLPNMKRQDLKDLHKALVGKGVSGIMSQIVAKVQATIMAAATAPTPMPPAPTPAPTPALSPVPATPPVTPVVTTPSTLTPLTTQQHKAAQQTIDGYYSDLVNNKRFTQADIDDFEDTLKKMDDADVEAVYQAIIGKPSGLTKANIINVLKGIAGISSTGVPPIFANTSITWPTGAAAAAPSPTPTPTPTPPSKIASSLAAQGAPIPTSAGLKNFPNTVSLLTNLANGTTPISSLDLDDIKQDLSILDKDELTQLSKWLGGPDGSTYWTRRNLERDLVDFIESENDALELKQVAAKAKATPTPVPTPAVPTTKPSGPPPGSVPPRPGLVWNPNTHRWIRPGVYEPPEPVVAKVDEAMPYVDKITKTSSGGVYITPKQIDHNAVSSFPKTIPSTFSQLQIPVGADSTFAYYNHTPSGYKVAASWDTSGSGIIPGPGQTGKYTITVLDGTGQIVSRYDSQAPRDEAYIKDRLAQVTHWVEDDLAKVAAQKKLGGAKPAPLAQFAWDHARANNIQPGVVPFKIDSSDWGTPANRAAVEGFLKAKFPKLVGAQQHPPHGGMDPVEHTMNIVNPLNLRTKGLSDRDAEILRLGMLFHDVGKQYDPKDHDHPRKSATDAEPLLWQFGLTPQEVSDTLAIIKWHDAYGDNMNGRGKGPKHVAKFAYEYTDDKLPPTQRAIEAKRINNLLMRAYQSDVSSIPGLTADPIPGRPDIKVSGFLHVDVDGPAFEKEVNKEIEKMSNPPSAIPLPVKPATVSVGAEAPYLVAPGVEWGELVQKTDNLPVGGQVPFNSTVTPPKEVYDEAYKHPELNYARAFNMAYDGPTGQIVQATHSIDKGGLATASAILNTGLRPGNVNAFGHGVYTFLNGTDNIDSNYINEPAIVVIEAHLGRCIDHDELNNTVVPAYKKANPAEAKKLSSTNLGSAAVKAAAALWAGYSTITDKYYGGDPIAVIIDPARIRMKSVVNGQNKGNKGLSIKTINGTVKSPDLTPDEKNIPKTSPNYMPLHKNKKPNGWNGAPRTS